MDGFQPHRFAGGDLPPPPPPPPPPTHSQQHQNQYWYPPPPPPPPSSTTPHQVSPYPVPPYAHHYPQQPPPQWPPPTPLAPVAPFHGVQPPAPPQAPPYAYPPAPPGAYQAHLQLPPHHVAASSPYPAPPPPPNQGWTNPSWVQNQGYEAMSGEEDWAAKAKAWASNPQVPAQQFLMNDQKKESNHMQYQEVSSSYSSSQGTKDGPVQYESTHSHVPPAQYTQGYSHGTVGMVDHSTVATSEHVWGPPSNGVPFPLPAVPPSVPPQMDVPFYGGIGPVESNYGPSVPPVPFGMHTVPAHHHTEVFTAADPICSLSIAERPKKAAVPNWLREEILKNKTVQQNSNSLHSIGFEDGDKSIEKSDQTDTKSVDLTKSTEDEDDEDEVEATRTAAINQEIKRVLTEVLLKVTDDLFDEIATKVLNEDDSSLEDGEPATDLVKSKPSDSPVSKSTVSPKAKIMVTEKSTNNKKSGVTGEDLSPVSTGGDILGLSNYASDDDNDDDDDETETEVKGKDKQTLPLNNTNDLSPPMQNELSNHEELLNKGQNSDLPDVDRSTNLTAVGTNNDDKTGAEIMNTTDITCEHKKDEREAIKEDAETNGEQDTERKKEHRRDEEREKEDRDRKSEQKGDDDRKKEATERKREESRDDEREKERKRKREEKRDDERKKEDRERKGEQRMDDDRRKEDRERKREQSKEDERLKEDRGRKREQRRDDERKKEDRERSRELRREDERKRDGERKREDRERKDSVSKSSKRSVSPRGRSRSNRDRSSDEHSENSKRRNLQSHRTSSSRSPSRSRNRHVSRSPRSNRSHRRYSPYSSTERRRRSRSRTPIKRR